MDRRIDVVMPVRNVLPFLDACIESILGQTYGDFDFLILDDGSTDGTFDSLREWVDRDSRIQLFRQDRSLGPVGSSNYIAYQATHALVARMDGDDIAHSDRLRRQIAVFRERPDACLVGTGWEGIDAQGRRVRPRDRTALSIDSRSVPFAHGSIMYRRDAFLQIGGYRPGFDYCEDFDLCHRFLEAGRVFTLPDVLYSYRFSPTSARLTACAEEVDLAVEQMYEFMDGKGAGSSPSLCRLEPGAEDRRIARPRVFVARSSNHVWSGRRCDILGRLVRRGRLSLSVGSFAALAWGLWSAISPKSLRFCLRTILRVSDFRVRKVFADGSPVEWRGGRNHRS